jgi:glycosyltransferase involved in cell wall biosynthesis
MKQKIDLLIFENRVPKKEANGLSNIDRVETIIAAPINSGPLVSCLMVTRGSPSFVHSAIHQFNMQTYTNKELIIIYDMHSQRIQKLIDIYSSPTIRFYFIDTKKTLGDLRNLAINFSQGEIFCQWDDDDIFIPDRISFFVTILMNSKVAACFLSRWIFWDISKNRVAISDERPWEGSIFAWKKVKINYPSISKSEDFIAISELCNNNITALVDNPYAYVYCAHGDNTWNNEHMDVMYNSSTKKLDYSKTLPKLAGILPLYIHPSLEIEKRCELERIYYNKINLIDKKIDEIDKIILQRNDWYKKLSFKNKIILFIPTPFIKILAEMIMTIGQKTHIRIIHDAGMYIWRAYKFKEKHN